MELPWLYSFNVLADLLHFGRAAAALHMSQSALSVQIRNLEASLKVTLFERDRRSVSLTVAGQVFLEDVHRLLRELEDAQRRAQRAAKGELGLIRIGFVSAGTVRIIPRIIRYYKRNFPGVELRIRNLPTAQQIEALLRKEIDVGIVRLPIAAAEIAITPLSEEPLVCFLPKRHPLARYRKIAPQRLRSEPFILYERRQAPGFYDRILDICLRSGFSPLALQEAREMQTILSLVASEMGVSILPKSAAALGIKDVAVRPLAGRWPQSELGVATLRSSADEPRLRKFLTTAVQLQQGSAPSDEKK
jgi:DNA-binding transcriptional LysR family regulator